MSAADVKRWFPNAIDADALTYRVKELVYHSGGRPNRTLLCTSLCSDEVNAVSTRLPQEFIGPFVLGGLAGVPFAGRTGLAAFAAHVPEKGTAVIWYGPHVGITAGGQLGKVQRPRQPGETSCCGALFHALEKFQADAAHRPHEDPLDVQQAALEGWLADDVAGILAADSPPKALTDWAWELVDAHMAALLEHGRAKFADVTLIVVGGVVINSAHGEPDWFDLRREEVHAP